MNPQLQNSVFNKTVLLHFVNTNTLLIFLIFLTQLENILLQPLIKLAALRFVSSIFDRILAAGLHCYYVAAWRRKLS